MLDFPTSEVAGWPPARVITVPKRKVNPQCHCDSVHAMDWCQRNWGPLSHWSYIAVGSRYKKDPTRPEYHTFILLTLKGHESTTLLLPLSCPGSGLPWQLPRFPHPKASFQTHIFSFTAGPFPKPLHVLLYSNTTANTFHEVLLPDLNLHGSSLPSTHGRTGFCRVWGLHLEWSFEKNKWCHWKWGRVDEECGPRVKKSGKDLGQSTPSSSL